MERLDMKNLPKEVTEKITEIKQEMENPIRYCKERGCEVRKSACMFCSYGHMLECHWPKTCEEANCSHFQTDHIEE